MNIQLKDVVFKSGNQVILQDINLDLPPNKIYGLLGKNGAGKTTLLSLLAGYLKQTTGDITANGATLFENQSVIGGIQFVYNRKIDSISKPKKALKSLKTMYPSFDLEYAFELLKKFEIPENVAVKKLSLGKQSALRAIAGLANRVPVTIYDEIYTGMDAQTRELFYEELLQDYYNYPRTIILSTHIISEMENLFEEVIMVDNGKIILKESTLELQEKSVAIIGEKTMIKTIANEFTVIAEEELVNQKRIVLFEKLTEEQHTNLENMNLKIESIPLQSMFIHLTQGGKRNEKF